MTKVLMFGFGPLPFERLRLTGPSLRTWHLLQSVLDAGHEVCLVSNRTHGIYPTDLQEISSKSMGTWVHHSVSNSQWFNPSAIHKLVEIAACDCAIGVTTPGA